MSRIGRLLHSALSLFRSTRTPSADPTAEPVSARPLTLLDQPDPASRAHLQMLRSGGVTRVRIRSSQRPDTAPACRALDGEEMTIEAALANGPLPLRLDEGACQCAYIPVYDTP